MCPLKWLQAAKEVSREQERELLQASIAKFIASGPDFMKLNVHAYCCAHMCTIAIIEAN